MKEYILERDLYKKIEKYIHRKEIFGIRGPRQVGKTTLLKQIFSKLEGKKEFVNLENFLVRRELEENPISFIKRYGLEKGGYLFLDEIQLLKDGGSILKLIYDSFENLKIFFSGSSSLEIKTNILPKLVGRLWLFNLYSLSFKEYLRKRDKALMKMHEEYKQSILSFLKGDDYNLSDPSYIHDFLDLWNEYVVYGGYPEVVKSNDDEEKRNILSNIVSLHIEKDIGDYFNINDYESFFNFIKFLSVSVGTPLSFHSIASMLSQSHYKILTYFNASLHSYIVAQLKPFYKGNITTEIRKSPKIYFLDLGIRNAVLKNYVNINSRSDAGPLLENYIFNELIRTDEFELNYWRNKNKNEIDFVVRTSYNINAIIECKFSFDKIPKTMYNFMDKYDVKRGIIFTQKDYKFVKKNNKEILVLPAYYL